MQGQDDSLRQLLSACQGGDEDSWLRLFSLCHPCARRVAMAPPFYLNAEDAEDIVQEVLIDVHKSIGTIRNPKAFACVAAHNKCVDRLRKKRIPLSSAVDAETMQIPDTVRPVPVSWADAPAVGRLRELLAGIGERWAKILYLRYFEELEYAEIAKRLDMPVNQVGVYLTRALTALRDELKRHDGLWTDLDSLFG